MPVATQVKRRRGTAEENNAFTGAEGEITVDLTNKTLRVHDGETQGGTTVETQRNKSTTLSIESTDAQYPSAKAVVNYVSENAGVPTGALILWFGDTPPAGFLALDGSAVSRTTYALLFEKIGSQFSTGIFNWKAADNSSYFTNSATLSGTPITAYNEDGSVAGTMASYAGTQVGQFTPTGGTVQVGYARNADADKPTFNLPDARNRTLWGSETPGYLDEQLPNITGEFIAVAFTGVAGTGTGALYLSGADAARSGVETGAGRNSHLGFDASKSSSTYTNDGVVRPNSVGVLICVKY